MSEIAARAPGFAGMFWDSAGRLVIRTTPYADPSAVVKAIGEPEIGQRFRGVHEALVETRFEVVPNATFDFRTLVSLRDSLRPTLKDRRVVSISIDEARNTVRIGSTSAANDDRIRGAAAGLSIPTAAVALVRDRAANKETRLGSTFRPIPGGVRVQNYYGGNCAVGVNVSADDTVGFITASHCTAVPWDVDYINFYQPSYSQNNLVGYEVVDPTPAELFRSCDPYDYDLCRLSDAAFILYDSGSFAQLGAIARTEDLGSTTIDSWNPRFSITDADGWLLEGADVYMMGPGSGWTTGEVTETCVDRPGWFDDELYPYDTALLCQTEADYDSDEGDSGGPVFTWDSGDDVTLQGIHVGSNGQSGYWHRSYFSTWTWIAFELGTVLGPMTPISP